jgi:hypothetical protein
VAAGCATLQPSGGWKMSIRGVGRCAFAVICVIGLAGCTAAVPAKNSAEPAAGTCRSAVKTGELPDWARGGFSPGTSVPYVLGDGGDIVAVLLGDPLHAPPLPGKESKILWVARVGTDSAPTGLAIEARLANSDLVVTREVANGPGPSIVDLPRAGCWNLSLSWAGHKDALAIVYQAA